MNIEVRLRGGRKLYYLAHSFRVGTSVRKVRKYLGADLSESRIKGLKNKHKAELLKRAEKRKSIGDPLAGALSEKDLENIDGLIAGFDFRILHLSKSDWVAFTERFAYDTNAIEGSTVTLGEVKDIIEGDKWPGGRSRAEIAETYGVAQAIEHIRTSREHISLRLIRQLHKTVFGNSKSYAGQFRERGIEVAIKDRYGAVIHRGTPQKDIEKELRSLIKWYAKNKKRYHPLVTAAVVHNQFENIHPFQDGNGRVGRLLMNNILLKNGLSPVNIELKNRQRYYHSLKAYGKDKDIRPTIDLLLKEYRQLKKDVTT